ncbi:MAG: divalent-cation tolerance protein CutA [Pirellulales bacterium]|nr:divalent-cation tolerance protein CutA [Pirellulales bacterium]
MSDYIQIMTTTDDRSVADSIAESLVKRRLAACVQVIGPVQSTFQWEGKVQTASEYHCIAKSRIDLFALAEVAIREAHNYDVPEILSIKINEGSVDYLKWMDGVLMDPSIES